MADPLVVRMEHNPGKAAMPFDQFLMVFGAEGDGERSGQIRAELQRRGLLIAGNVDPHAAYPVLAELRTRASSPAPATRSPRKAKPRTQTRSLEALLSLGLDSESPGITNAEAELLAQHEHEEYWASRRERRHG